jgi:hypothetical protein
MKKIVLIACAYFFSINALLAQQSFRQILSSSKNYNTIVSQAEQYFRNKHPNLTQKQMSEGPNRDGEFVKFKRWQSFWKKSLTADGNLGDISAYWKKKATDSSNVRAPQSPYASVSWTNLSYENYIVSQIGLGRTTSIGFYPTNPNIFYVGAAIGGIWRTVNGGQTYTPLGDELPFMAVSSIIVNKDIPQFIYIAVSDHVWYGPSGIGVYKSINNGATWQPTALSFELENDIRIYWMEADPNNSNKMFVATSDGLYRTDNGFITVARVNSLNTFDVKINKGNSSIVYQCGNNGEFLRSTNGGDNFSLVQDFGNGNVYAATTSLNTSKVYARNGNTLYKSTNNGASFSATTNTLPEGNSVLAFSPANENILLTGNFETQRSDNDGVSFSATSQWLGNNSLPLIHVDQRNIFTNPLQPDFVYYCNDGGVYRYVVSTNQFVNLCDDLLITQFYDIAVSQSNANVIGGGSQDNGNVFRDSTGTWDEYAPTGDGMNQEIDPSNSNIRYWAYQFGELHRWVNNGNTHISPPGLAGQGAWETPFKLDPNNSNRIVAGYNKVYESLNRGTNWTDISGSANFGGNLEQLAIAKSNSNRIYAAIANNLFVKDVSGNTWTAKSLPGPSISDLEVDPLDMNLVYVTVPGFINGSKVFKSLDAGTTWINISGTLPNISTGAIEIYESIAGGLFVGTDAGVYYRDNTLGDWQLYGKLPHTRVEDIEIQYAEKLIRIGTHGRGVLEAPIIIKKCDYGDPDADNDGVCDANDVCPGFNNNLEGTPCDDGDPNTIGEKYINCECTGGGSNAAYCFAAGSAGTGGDWIRRIRLNTLDHSSVQTLYSNFKNHSTFLGAGSIYTLTVNMNYSFPDNKVYAWIDYDRDGTFEPSELISMSALDANHQSQGLVNVPSTIGTLATTMRVRTIYANPNNPAPCGNLYAGEVEDYTIDFTNCAASGHLGTGSDWINRVKLNTIDNTSVQTFYSDFKHLSTDLARGESYPVEVRMNGAFVPNDVYVWIDYNHNSIFESSERIIMSKPAVGPNAVSSGVVNIPSDALPGKTIMRVRSQFDDPDAPQPCGSSQAGEVEDYTINITYCAAKGAAGTGDDFIKRVSLNTISNISGKLAYSNFKNISTELTRGASYPIEVEINYGFNPDSAYVWIDYNKDGQFANSEQTIMSKLPVQWNSVANGTVQVPESAIQGQTVMRVRVIYASPNTANSCGEYDGEAEDYTVNLTYCGGIGSAGTTADWIANVSVNEINNNSVQTGYSNFKNLSTPLYRNNSYELKVNINYAFDLDTVYAWVDYDKNNSFTSNERISMSNLVANGNSTSTGVINVPTGTALGENSLRVRVLYGNPNPPDPCNAYFGEVEDYTLVFTDNQGAGPCTTQVVLGKEYGSLASGIYKAETTIVSTSKILNGNNVRLKAGASITLNPGFNSDTGSVLSLTIEPCN